MCLANLIAKFSENAVVCCPYNGGNEKCQSQMQSGEIKTVCCHQIYPLTKQNLNEQSYCKQFVINENVRFIWQNIFYFQFN